MLNAEKLSVIKRNVALLKNISMEAFQGRITLLLGKSGSGKTTLLRCLAQLERGYAGEIFSKGQKVTGLGPKERCKTFGFVPQNYALFPHMSALENCVQPLSLAVGRKIAKAEAEKMLALFGMDAYTAAFPHQLSGGQQQRVALARTLMFSPSWILLDEPTSSLDPKNTELLIEVIQRLKEEGKGLIISTQDMPFATKILDRAYFLENGSILETYDRLNAAYVPKQMAEFLRS